MATIKKSRTESTELIILRFLHTRMTLSEKDKQHFFRLQKGYEGEVKFDSLTEKLHCQCIIINDLLLKVNNTLFQIDSLLIGLGKLHFYEVKNNQGDYYYESDRLYKKPKIEYNNPLLQLNRSESLLRQLLQDLGINIPIEAQAVFINPAFTLYQAPLNKPFIFPTQVNSYMKKLDTNPLRLNPENEKLADKLISLHIEESPYTLLPTYDYAQLRKGITCAVCRSFFISVCGKKCVCGDCGHEEFVDAAVLRSVRELKLLFPGCKITTNGVHDWCHSIGSKKMICRILSQNFRSIGFGRWIYYE